MVQTTQLNSGGDRGDAPERRNDDRSELRKLVGGKRAAFERLFHPFAPLIEGFHHRRSTQPLSAEAPEELVQAVMFRD